MVCAKHKRLLGFLNDKWHQHTLARPRKETEGEREGESHWTWEGGGGKTEGNQQKGREVGVTGQVCECGWGARLTEIKKRKHEGREGGKKNHWIWDGGGGG